MTTLSVRDIGTHCLGLSGDMWVNTDLYGYIYRDTDGSVFGTLDATDTLPGSGAPTTRSLRRHLETVTGRAVDLVMFLVGHETDFSGAVSRDDVTKVQYGIQVARDLYAQVDLGIRRIIWRRVSVADAGGFIDIDGDGEAKDLTHAYSGPPDAVDVFVVQNIAGTEGGLGPAHPPGSCDKDQNLQTTGVLVQLIALDRRTLGLILAHEVGHYLGLDHVETITNLMYPTAFPQSTGLTTGQADIMKEHCFMNPAC
jgi:hypothetical protein